MNRHACPSVGYKGVPCLEANGRVWPSHVVRGDELEHLNGKGSTSHSGILTRWLIGRGDKPAIFELVFEGFTCCCSFSDRKFSFFLFTLTLAVHSPLTAPVLEETEKLWSLPESRLFPPSVCQDRLCNNIAPLPPTLEPVLCSHESTHQLIVEKYWEIQTPGCLRTLELSQTAMFS